MKLPFNTPWDVTGYWFMNGGKLVLTYKKPSWVVRFFGWLCGEPWVEFTEEQKRQYVDTVIKYLNEEDSKRDKIR